MIGGWPSGPRLTLEAMSLSDLVSWAYNTKPWLVAGGPAWASSSGIRDRSTLDDKPKRFDIIAKAEGDAERPIDEFRQMMQTLLSERFHLELRRETRETAVRSEEHTSELQSHVNLVCRLLLEKKKIM